MELKYIVGILIIWFLIGVFSAIVRAGIWLISESSIVKEDKKNQPGDNTV
jgi:hypothetical protein